jgi:hypothetical protein
MVGCMYFFEQENERVGLLTVQPRGSPGLGKRPTQRCHEYCTTPANELNPAADTGFRLLWS